MTMKKKKYNARFPPARIKKIMQTDEDVGKVAQPVPVIISRALELFVENLLKKANDITTQRGARTLTPSHMKMCIKSEKRFDFLKELVSSVPDLQGDHDDPQGGPPGGAMGLDLTMSTLKAASASKTSSTSSEPQTNTSTSASIVRPNKLPRQLSTPRPRGRPRTVSADSDSKIPKKRRKKRPRHRFVDDLDEEISDENMSNDEVFDVENNTITNDHTTNPNSIVTCTVTTGLTDNHINGSSVLGFTLSIPSTSLTSPLSTLNSHTNGVSTPSLSDPKAANLPNGDKCAPGCAPAMANNAHQGSKPVADVDEDYDDC